MIYTTGTIAVNGNTVTGTGTNFTAAGSLIRVGCTLISMSSPVQVFQITSINSATQLTVTRAASPALAAGTRYSILLSDSLSVDGLAQSITETFTMYQRYMSGFADVMNGAGDTTITIDGAAVTVPGQKSLAKKGANNDITSLSALSTAITVGQGGTGATTAAQARANLEVLPTTGGIISGDLEIKGKSKISSTGSVIFKGFTDSSRPAGVNTNDLIISTPDGSSAGAYCNQLIYQWYADGWISGIKRGAAYGSIGYGIYFNGVSTGGVSREWLFNTDGTASGAGAWVNGSDERHKSNITPVANALEAVCNWRGASYDVKDGGKGVGLIAQDVEKWCPTAIKTYGDREFSDKTVIEDFKYLDTSGVAAAYHTEAIKELNGMIIALKKEVADLRNKPVI